MSFGGVVRGYPIDSHRLSSVVGLNRTYDAAGNTTKIGGSARQFGYDGSGRMTQVKAGNTVLRQYDYNAKGEQTRAYLDADSTYFVHDEAGHLLGEYDTSGVPKQQILWFGDLPVGVLQGAGPSQQLHYIEPDHLGTPRVIIDGTRNVPIWEWGITGEAFGNSPPNQDPDQDGQAFTFDLRFPGQRYDAASGLNYNYFRDYDPATGRYVQSDPIGLNGGISTYEYISASPLRSVDPLGLVEWSGTISYYQLGVVGTVGVYEAELTSQCVGGRRAKVKVRAGGGGVGWGVKGLPFASNQTPITLKDYLTSIQPENFNGLFFTMGVGFQFLGVGISCGGMQFGNHWAPAVTVGPMSCDPAGMGIDIGAGAVIGSSRLIGSPRWESCNECSPVDTPFRTND